MTTTKEPAAITFGCYVRVKATGAVGRVGGIYRHEETRKRTFGIDWGGEFEWSEIERITPAEYRATPEHLKSRKGSVVACN